MSCELFFNFLFFLEAETQEVMHFSILFHHCRMPAYNSSSFFAVFFILHLLVNTYIFMSVFLAVVYNNYKKYLKVPPRISASCWPGTLFLLLCLFGFLQHNSTLWPLGGDAAAGEGQKAQDGAGVCRAAAAAGGRGASGG